MAFHVSRLVTERHVRWLFSVAKQNGLGFPRSRRKWCRHSTSIILVLSSISNFRRQSDAPCHHSSTILTVVMLLTTPAVSTERYKRHKSRSLKFGVPHLRVQCTPSCVKTSSIRSAGLAQFIKESNKIHFLDFRFQVS